MHSMLLSASRAKPEVRLGYALSSFEEGLSNDKRSAFRRFRHEAAHSTPTLEDVGRVVAEFDQRPGKPYGSRFVNVLKTVQQFAVFGDVIVGGGGNIVPSAVWGCLRLTLSFVTNLAACREKVSELFMEIGQTAPRHKQLALLYPSSKRLQSDLIEYFIIIVELCHHLFQSESLLGQIKSRLKLALVDPELKNIKDQLDKWANSIDREISFLIAQRVEDEARENSNFRSLWTHVSESEKKRKRMKARLAWLGMCSEYDYERERKRIRKQGNTTFFLQEAAYENWKNRNGSTTLMCRGILGSGKSVLMANMVDDLVLSQSEDNYSVAYFFISDDAESMKARTIFGCLARQILDAIPHMNWTELLSIRSRNLEVDDIASILCTVFPNGRRIFVILDGLDQCPRGERLILLDHLQSLRTRLELRVCGSLRLEANFQPESDFLRLQPEFVLEMPTVNPEIGSFVEAELQMLLQAGDLAVGNPGLLEEIRDCLVDGANGMFLWVVLQLQAICLERSDKAIRQALQDIPRSLPATFDQILTKSQKSGPQYQMSILKILTSTYRPLTTEELREALSIVPGNTCWSEDSLINDVNKVLACCGSLIVVDEEEHAVHFVHPSVRQFLLGEMKDSSALEQWQFTAHDAHGHMAGVTVTYLGIYETTKQMAHHEESSNSHVNHATQPVVLPHPSQNITLIAAQSGTVSKRFVKAVSKMYSMKHRISETVVDITNVVADMDAPDIVDYQSSRTGRFLEYAKSHWLQHSVAISEDDNGVFTLWKRLVQRPEFDQSLDWSDVGSSIISEIKAPRALLWAILHSHHALLDLELGKHRDRLRLLANCLQGLSNMPPQPALDRKMATRLLGASLLLRGRGAMTKRLLDMEPDLSYGNYTSLYVAVLSNNLPVIRRLVSQIKSTDVIRDLPFPLVEIAVSRGHVRAVYFLVKHGADVNKYTNSPPLAIALARIASHNGSDPCYLRIAYILLKAGADVKHCRRQHLAPAVLAFRDQVNVRFFNSVAYIKPTAADMAFLYLRRFIVGKWIWILVLVSFVAHYATGTLTIEGFSLSKLRLLLSYVLLLCLPIMYYRQPQLRSRIAVLFIQCPLAALGFLGLGLPIVQDQSLLDAAVCLFLCTGFGWIIWILVATGVW
ncbi:hypothetical protein B0T17DRAFT_299547 [Bombardia bombarda]|uniref:NACHT domain-containing protein n=1 Tax=Bombardia bombarda TaxID=252184 RepID=A0AA40C278_9PEZI|nr:hypothetical protein B0T17DRAFT_299547 [Bombardia bombarda]